MNRRSLIAGAAAALGAPLTAGAAPAACWPSHADRMAELCNAYVAAFTEWEAAGDDPREIEFQGPVTSALAREMQALADKIRCTPITSAAGFAAFCRFVHVSNFIGDRTDAMPDLHRWRWVKIMDWSGAAPAPAPISHNVFLRGAA
ncbi:hypothetical protein [Paracoccus yeei]|nr:hypothetical protein [Paracoccus yeei]